MNEGDQEKSVFWNEESKLRGKGYLRKHERVRQGWKCVDRFHKWDGTMAGELWRSDE